MLLKFALALSALAVALPQVASAQTAGNTNTTCSLTNTFVGFNAADCVGFFSGNQLGGSGGMVTTQNNAVNQLLGTTGVNYYDSAIEKYDVPNNTPVDFDRLLYGTTVVGFHFGNGSGTFPSGFNGTGGGTAFFKFDAGNTGLNTFQLVTSLSKSSSGATLYTTGRCQGNCSQVPEPASALLAMTGLAGLLGFASRRRSKNA